MICCFTFHNNRPFVH